MKFKLSIILAVFGLMIGAATVYAAPPNSSTADVFNVESGVQVPGASSTLVRNDSGINITMHTNSLPEGAYTFWGVIFNNPNACNGGVSNCGMDDFGTEDVGASVLRVTGKVVKNGDNAHFGGHISVGDTSEALFGPGLVNPLTAAIHFLVRYHGPVIPDEMPDMIHTFEGGCVSNGGCTVEQATAHLP